MAHSLETGGHLEIQIHVIRRMLPEGFNTQSTIFDFTTQASGSKSQVREWVFKLQRRKELTFCWSESAHSDKSTA